MAALSISQHERDQLEAWLADPVTPARLRVRAGIVKALAEGLADREVARQQNVARQTVALWRRRVVERGTALTITTDAPGRGRKPTVSPAVRDAVCNAFRLALRQGRIRSVRDLAREFSLSAATVHRTLRNGISEYAEAAANARTVPARDRAGGEEMEGESSSPAA